MFEDVHWSDPNLLDLVETLAMRAHTGFRFCSSRSPDPSSSTRAPWGGRLSSYTSLTLGPLGETRRASSPCGGSPIRSRTDEVVRIAEGNPLFIEQLAATIGET